MVHREEEVEAVVEGAPNGVEHLAEVFPSIATVLGDSGDRWQVHEMALSCGYNHGKGMAA
jgi:hypothetical protein